MRLYIFLFCLQNQNAVFLIAGIGWTMFCISFFSCMYYNMLVAYSFFYTFASFAKTVPWLECGNIWNSPGKSKTGFVLENNYLFWWLFILGMIILSQYFFRSQFSLIFALNEVYWMTIKAFALYNKFRQLIKF